jgi:hypothetical protein
MSPFAESAATALVQLMALEIEDVDTGYVAAFAKLGVAEADLISWARRLAAGLTDPYDTTPRSSVPAFGAGAEPVSVPDAISWWRGTIERLNPAEVQAFLSAYATPAADGAELLWALAELRDYRQYVRQQAQSLRGITHEDRGELGRLEGRRREVGGRIRSRYPAAIRTEQVQAALQNFPVRLEPAQPPEALPVPDVDPEQRAAYDQVTEQSRRVHDAALRQLEQQRAQLVQLRDQYTMPQARAGFEQAIAQLDVALEMTRQQHAEAMAQLARTAAQGGFTMTAGQQRAFEQAMGAAAQAGEQAHTLATASGQAAAAAGRRTAETLQKQHENQAISGELTRAVEAHSAALRTLRLAEDEAHAAQRSGDPARARIAAERLEQARLYLAELEQQVTDLESRLRANQQALQAILRPNE